jgi:hypothetical protein
MQFEEYCDISFAPDLGLLPKVTNFPPPPDVASATRATPPAGTQEKK